ncbi:ferric reductase-like transmembrane domain-containing protein [Candidatus Micrarchaeota archaeon]|nr:ferric reductase-like transmembrane domain-containing protein [Candidatus Micrarchaeota archaeon]
MINRETIVMLTKNARTIVYVIAFILAIGTWFIYADKGNISVLMANAFGYLSFSFISLALMVSPIRAVWPTFSLNPAIFMGRRAIGVSGFIFAAMHYIIQVLLNFAGDPISVFGFALGPGGLGLLAGVIALPILFLLFITSFDLAVKTLGKSWYTLHKLIYLAYPLIIFHAYTIGIDFQNTGLNLYSGSFFLIAIVTLVLEGLKIYKGMTKPKPAQQVQQPVQPIQQPPQQSGQKEMEKTN